MDTQTVSTVSTEMVADHFAHFGCEWHPTVTTVVTVYRQLRLTKPSIEVVEATELVCTCRRFSGVTVHMPLEEWQA